VSESFGDRVRRLRKKEHHWTQEKFSELSEISVRHLGEIERGETSVQSLSVETVEKLARGLNMHPARLLYPDYKPEEV
jgi:transcriptional regulator with XRE-family HTH domain